MTISQLERQLHQIKRERRKFKEFNAMTQNIHPSHRVYNGFKVYVDEENRQNFKLEDYSKFVEEELPEYCSIQRENYNREMRQRPEVSFIAKNEAKFR